jgi:uncharacterized protein YcaQ
MSGKPLVISVETARRFILGKQGLWPGRRWAGRAGTQAAMHAIEHLQLDPLVVIARSQDIMLHSRVQDYEPELWQELAYGERRFFDWGGWLAVRPMQELPYWRTLMLRTARHPEWSGWADEHAALLDEMRAALRSEGPLMNRDFAAADRKRVVNYRGRKDSALALYHLWRTGEVMVHDRRRFERVYDLTERIAPGELIFEADETETDLFLLRKAVAFHGLFPLRGGGATQHRRLEAAEYTRLRNALLERGEVVPVRVEGWKALHYALAGDVALLHELAAGRVPREWQPLGESTLDAVAFLAPLDVVSARGRAKPVFDFDYVWEVYKPEHKRRWGYYTLPILWGDRLVARTDLKLDRASSTLQLRGFWLEQEETGRDPAFAQALGRGLADFMRFVAAERLDADAVRPVALRRDVLKAVRSSR